MFKVSPSAKGVAYLRHIEAAVSLDILAKHFCDEEGKAMADKWIKLCPYVDRTVAIRGRYIDDVAARYIEEHGIHQMINVPAGLNTFPYRHKAATKLEKYAELDLPAMIEFKNRTIGDLRNNGDIPQTLVHVDYIPIDLASKNFFEKFKGINWDHEKPTICVFEGMSYYLPLETLENILNTFAKVLPKGSVLLWDYFPDYVEENIGPLMSTIVDVGGEVCLTYLSEDKLKRLCKGFNIISDDLESELEKKYYPDHIAKPVGSIVVAEKE